MHHHHTTTQSHLAHSALFRWSYGTLHAHVLAPIAAAIRRVTDTITGHCRAARNGVVGAAKGAVQFLRDGVEVAWLCLGMLLLGRSPSAAAAAGGGVDGEKQE